MKIVLFGGGTAGAAAAHLLSTKCGDWLAGVVWDDAMGDPPDFTGVPFFTEGTCRGEGDTLLCSGYGRILKADTLSSFSRGAFNAHPSILPNYRGRHAIQWAIAEGESELGVTVHRMIPKVDRGEIIMVSTRSFGLEDDFQHISSELAQLAADMLIELANLLQRGDFLGRVKQGEGNRSIWRRRKPEDSRVVFENGSRSVLNTVRATGAGAPAYARKQSGERVIFTGYLASDTPGTVLFASPEGCLISTSDGVVWLEPNHPLKVGQVLE